MSSDTKFVDQKWQPLLNIGLLALFWGMLAWQLGYEWAHNGQYSYGLFVPFLAIYLIHLRWEDHPQPRPPNRKALGLVLALLVFVVVLHYPLKIIFLANADWRLIVWFQALLLIMVTMSLLWYWGGWPWVWHFGFPFFFVLTAVPWPRWIENQLVIHFMNWVAAATVDTVNFLGVYAKQSGNLIFLKSGAVSVEEACSGVRSFQSTIMGAFFMGEFMRFSIITRVCLVFTGAGLALFFNFCRTLALTLISDSHGDEVMSQWHDPAGYMVFFLAIAGLGLICYVLRKLGGKRPSRSGYSGGPFSTNPGWIPMKLAIVVLVSLMVSEPISHLWYTIRGPDPKFSQNWTVDWHKGTQDLKFEEIESRIQDVLFYDKGEMVTWKTPNKYSWMAYFFEWNTGKAAQLGGVHNPEICLPATGWIMTSDVGELTWQGPDDLKMIFNSYVFEANSLKVYVFYCQWDPQGYPYYTKAGRFREDRLRDAWVGDRKEGKRVLEIIIQGPDGMRAAQDALVHFLDQAIQAEPARVP